MHFTSVLCTEFWKGEVALAHQGNVSFIIEELWQFALMSAYTGTQIPSSNLLTVCPTKYHAKSSIQMSDKFLKRYHTKLPS